MLGTIEFIPDEGRYHFDGHRACKVCLHPRETKKLGGVCPKCKKPVTVGVLSRVEELANEPEGRVPSGAPKFWPLVELDKIIAEALGVKGRTAKGVDNLYWNVVKEFGNELSVLLDVSGEKIAKVGSARLAEAIDRVRKGKVKIDPGYDGNYGIVEIFSGAEKDIAKQKTLF